MKKYTGEVEVIINYIVYDFDDFFPFLIYKEKVNSLFSALSIAEKFLPSGWVWSTDNEKLWIEIKEGIKPLGRPGDICSIISAEIDGGNKIEAILTPIFDDKCDK